MELKFAIGRWRDDSFYLFYLRFFYRKDMREKNVMDFTMDLMKDQAVLPVIGISKGKKDLFVVYAETNIDDLRMVHLLKPPR